MARLTEIEDGESVGIGLAGSELPKRRTTKRVRSVEDLSAKVRATTQTQTQTQTQTMKPSSVVVIVTRYVRGAVIAAIIAALITRVLAVVR
jgi:hypothetical protein